jgi:hypothetical protein
VRIRRLLDSDPDELRAEYLFYFAHFCGLGPSEVDALLYSDFVTFIIAIDAYLEAMSKTQE